MQYLINRPLYLNRLVEFKDKTVVKIITGIRRSGKSSLLELFSKHLLDSGVAANRIIHMNLESLKYRDLNDYLSFYDYIAQRIVAGSKCYLIFDELQVIDQWEKAIESFRLDFDVDIYITGSNAHMLSTEFSTLLSGRYVEIRVLPLSFKEFLQFYNFDIATSVEDKFQKYLQFGGMPTLAQFELNELRSFEALEGIYNTVILRDVMERNRVADQALLHKLSLFLCSNIGSLTSPNNIGNILSNEGNLRANRKQSGRAIAGKTVDKYIGMLKDAFVFYSASRYDIKGKELLKTLEKTYVIDLGFRNMLLGFRDADRGHILENIVFLELLRRDYRVYVGKFGDSEVDFIAEKPDEKLYIQVTESMSNDIVKTRELRPLKAIGDNHEKLVLSMDRSYISSIDGIKLSNIIDFLLQ